MSDPFQVTPGGAGDTQFQPVPAGQHFAGLAAAIFLPNRPGYQGGAPQNEVQLVWIVPAYRDGKGQPRQVRNFVKWPDNPLHENANFAKLIRTWINLTAEQKATFNLRQIVGGRSVITTEIGISQQNRHFAKLTALAPVPPEAPPIDYTGVVVRVAPYPGMVQIAAAGVQVVLNQQQRQAAPPQPTAPAPGAPPPAQPVYGAAPPAPAAAPAAPAYPAGQYPGAPGAAAPNAEDIPF